MEEILEERQMLALNYIDGAFVTCDDFIDTVDPSNLKVIGKSNQNNLKKIILTQEK